MPKNLYSILQCPENASHSELKQNYQRLVKEHHPDKKTKPIRGTEDHEKFIEIDQAWKVLQDAASRRQYDATLSQENVGNEHVIHARLSQSQLEFHGDEPVNYPCRCGSAFVIHESYLNNGDECLIECEQCSNCILVT